MAILDKLRRGEIRTFTVTLVEGLTIDETAQAIVAAGLGEVGRLRAEFASPGRIADLDPSARHLEGYLFPDTYRFARGTGERELADTLVAAFRRQYESRVRPLRAADDLRPLRELVILASLVEKEARLDSERPLIAAVYANRLRRGIGLYADPTIIHGLKLLGRWNGNLHRADLRMESPWNTYRVPGLPPGPICSPDSPASRPPRGRPRSPFSTSSAGTTAAMSSPTPSPSTTATSNAGRSVPFGRRAGAQ